MAGERLTWRQELLPRLFPSCSRDYSCIDLVLGAATIGLDLSFDGGGDFAASVRTGLNGEICFAKEGMFGKRLIYVDGGFSCAACLRRETTSSN